MNNKLDLNDHQIIGLKDGINPKDAVNYQQLTTLDTKILAYTKDYTYRSIFTQHFYDLKEPSKFEFSLPFISGIENGLSFSHSGINGVNLDQFDPANGIELKKNMDILLDIGHILTQSSPFTLLISFTLKDDLHVFLTVVPGQHVYLPRYMVEYKSKTLTIHHMNTHVIKTYNTKSNDKQIMLLIKFDPVSQHYHLNIVGNAEANAYRRPLHQYAVPKLMIQPYTNIINKICFLDYYHTNSIDFNRLMYEEKKNGTYF